jgi:hypothetical protein
LGYAWLTTIFDRYIKQKARNGCDWRLFFVDGHGSYINMRFFMYCKQYKVLIAVYSPYSTHRLQLLDVSLFNLFANYYLQELNDWIHSTQGLCKISKREFFNLFRIA